MRNLRAERFVSDVGALDTKGEISPVTAGEGDLPIPALDAGRQGRSDARSSADADPFLEHGRGMTDTRCSKFSVSQ